MKENKKDKLVNAYLSEKEYEHLNYLCEKTEMQYFVSGINCNSLTAILTITKAVSAALTLACVKGC